MAAPSSSTSEVSSTAILLTLGLSSLVKFKVTGKDPKTGKLKLSKKVLMPKPERSDS